MKRLKNKLNKKSYSLFNKIDKIVRFDSFLNNESFENKKKYIEESFILENPNKTFKLTQKTINAIYQDLIIENLQNQVKFYKGDILYYSVKKVRDDYEKFCIENNLKPLNKTDFNDSISNILSLKQATTWSSILKDTPKLKTKRTYAWLPK